MIGSIDRTKHDNSGWHVPEPLAKGVFGPDRPRHAHRWALWACHPVLLVMAWLCVATPAQAETPEPAAEPVAYRRIFVPADNVPVWPRDGRNYLPIERHDFDRWIAAANQSAAGTGPAAQIVDAHYEARLEGDKLVGGQARWEIELRESAAAFLPLGQITLVVSEPAWRDAPAREVHLGLWGKPANEAQPYGLAVPRSGTLEFSWHALPTDSANGALEFALRLPPALRQRLVLDLPADRRPVLEGGVIVESSDLEIDEGTSPIALRRWILAAPQDSSARLRIERMPSEPTAAPPTSTMHEQLDYRIDSRGLEVTARLRLDASAHDLRRLAIKLSRGVHLLSATGDGRELAWRIVDDPTTDATQAFIELPPLPSNGQTEIVLCAWQQLVTDKQWNLPTLRPDGIFWTSGATELEMDPLVELRDLAPTDCVQIGVTAAPESDREPERLAFQSYSPAAGIAVVIGKRPPMSLAGVGTIRELGEPDEPGLIAELTPSAATDDLPNIDEARGSAALPATPDQLELDEVRRKMWLAPSGGEVPDTELFAPQVTIESICAVDGQSAHRVTYHLRHSGTQTLEFRLPTGAQLESARLDGRPIAVQAEPDDPANISISLSPDRPASTLALQLHTQETPLGNGSSLAPPLPEGNLPLLSGAWTVWLPEEFETDAGPAGQDLGASSLRSPSDALGWHAYQTSFVAAGPRPMTVSHPSTTTAWALAAFLAAAVGGAWLTHHAMVFVLSIAAAAALALLLPASYAPLATGAVWGLLASLVLCAVRRPGPRPVSDSTWSHPRTRPALATTTIVLLLLLVRVADALPPAATGESPPQPAIHTVLAPVAADGKPAGSKVYVSEDFLRELLARGAAATGGDWFVHHASYSGELKQAPNEAGLVPGAWKMTLNIEVLARDASIELPLVRGEAVWAIAASLDGIPVPLAWNDAGRGCTTEVAEPGRYQLSISFEPRVVASAGRAEVRLSVPPLPGATFQLACPPDTTDCEVPGHNIVRTSGQTADSFTSELAAENQLIVRWPGQQEPPVAAAGPSVAELLWLRVARDGVELDAKYLFEPGEDLPRVLTLSADNRWELLSDAVAESTGAVEADAGDTRSIRVQVNDAAAERREITLRFRLRDAPALGRHRFPPIGLTAPTATNRWLAVGCDPALECEATLDEGVVAATAEEFMSVWGDAADAPQLAFTSLREWSCWELAVRPHAVKSTIDEVLHVAAGRETLHLQYEAEIEPLGNYCYRLQLSAPVELEVAHIVAQTSEREIPLRWVRTDSGPTGRVNVFFDQEVEQPYRLVLTGRVPLGSEGRSAVPRVAEASAEQTPLQVVLYQLPDAEVELQGLVPIDAPIAEPDEIPPTDWPARQVGIFRVDRQTAETARIVVTERPLEVVAKSNATAETTGPDSPAGASEDEAPIVRLADTVVLIDAVGGQVTISRTTLAPAGLSRCSLRLSQGQELVRVAVDDQPAHLQPQGPREWTVRLGATRLPQILEVVTRSRDRRSLGASEIRLSRPTLLADGQPIPVELSLWSFCHPDSLGQPRVSDAAVATAAELHALRLERLVGVAEAATESARRLPDPEGPNWLSRWRAQLTAARDVALSVQHQAGVMEPSSQVPRSTGEERGEALGRVDVWLRQTQAVDADRSITRATVATRLLEDWSQTGLPDGRWTYCVAGDGTETLGVVLWSAGITQSQKRFAGLLAIACLTAATVWLVNRPASADLLWRWPQAAGVLLGLACWAWLSPAWIGLLVAGCSLALLFGRGWPARSVYVEGSTVLGDSRR